MPSRRVGASRLFFSGMDIDTAAKLAQTIGDTTIERVDARGNTRFEKEPLMTPAALRAMPDDQVLYLFANKRPTLLGVKPYFERNVFVRRTKSAAAKPIGGGVASRVDFVFI